MDPLTVAQAAKAITPVLDYGFAGFALVLVGVIVWLIRQLLTVLRQNNRVIERNTAAIVAITKDTEDTKRQVALLREELLKRSCLLGNPHLVTPAVVTR
jgi:hypothetical protein